MNTQRAVFKWLAAVIAITMFLQFSLVSPSVSAQIENTPTPTSTGYPPESSPGSEETSSGESEFMQPLNAMASNEPTPLDPDYSDGECVFRVNYSIYDAGENPECIYKTNWNEI